MLTRLVPRPSLIFDIQRERLLNAAVSDWPERQVLAVTSVRCALGRPHFSSRIPGTVTIEDGKLAVRIDGCMNEAIQALIDSGHAVRGKPRSLENVPVSQKATSYSGVWILNDAELEGIWVQSSCGIFVDICTPMFLQKATDIQQTS